MTNPQQQATGRGTIGAVLFAILAWVLVACIVLQTFFAGMAVFQDPAYWRYHVMFVHLFEFVPLLMIVFAFIGRLPKGTAWISTSLFAMIFVQYMTANLPGAGAFHPVIALALVVVSLLLVQRAHTHLRRTKRPRHDAHSASSEA